MTDYFHPSNSPRNLHNALQFDPEGNAELRVATRPSSDTPANVFIDNTDPIAVTLGSETITIIGNITVPTTVNVASTPTDPVHVHLTEVGSSGLLDVAYMPVGQSTSPWIVIGNVNIATNNGGIEVNNDTGNPLRIIGNVNTTVVGTVSVTQGTTPWITIGNVNVTNTPTVNIGTMPSTTGNVYVINSNTAPAYTQYGDSVQMDSSDRLRVALMGSQWWYVPTVDKDGDLRMIEAFQGTGAQSVFVQNLASVQMTSGLTYNSNTQITGSAIRISRRRHKTRPDVGLEWVGLTNWDGLQPNVTKRTGMFTSYNGVFFENDGVDLYAVVRRRLADGTIVEDRIRRDQFSEDRLDGTGPSGENWNLTTIGNITSVTSQANIIVAPSGNVHNVTYQMTNGDAARFGPGYKVTTTGLSPASFNAVGLVSNVDTGSHRVTVTYMQYPGVYSSATSAKMTNQFGFHNMYAYWFDYNGSRTDRIRFGIHLGQQKITLHKYKPPALGVQYTSAPAMSVREEMFNTGVPATVPSLTTGGIGVGIETTAAINPGFGVAISTVPVAFAKAANQEFAVLGIALRHGEPYQRSDLQIIGAQLVDIANVNNQQFPVYEYRLVLNPTLTGSIPTPINIGKATQMWDYATGVTVSGGIDLTGGFTVGTSVLDFTAALNFFNMGSNINNTSSDLIVLVAKLINTPSSDGSLLSVINFQEDL